MKILSYCSATFFNYNFKIIQILLILHHFPIYSIFYSILLPSKYNIRAYKGQKNSIKIKIFISYFELVHLYHYSSKMTVPNSTCHYHVYIYAYYFNCIKSYFFVTSVNNYAERDNMFGQLQQKSLVQLYKENLAAKSFKTTERFSL